MLTEARKYFRYLDLVREDIREEFDLLGINPTNTRIGDLGCGNGLTTFSLALEALASVCIGIDLFSTKITPPEIDRFIETVSLKCRDNRNYVPEICELITTQRVPKFQQGNIVTNLNLPQDLDLAYCKKVLVNVFLKEYAGIPSGEQGLIAGLNNIYQTLRPDGQLCAIEYYKDFILEPYFEQCGFHIQRRAQIERREIRSKGRTQAVSPMTIYLCIKSS